MILHKEVGVCCHAPAVSSKAKCSKNCQHAISKSSAEILRDQGFGQVFLLGSLGNHVHIRGQPKRIECKREAKLCDLTGSSIPYSNSCTRKNQPPST
jgi:hypothetical protein